MNFMLFKKVALIQALYSLPLIVASSLYIDDIFRATSGWMGYWLYDARPLTYLLMKILNLGNVISDISPLPLFISILSLSAASTILAKQITSKDDWITALAASSLGMSPLYIENLSYAFDGMTMSISILIAAYSATLNFRFSFAIKAFAVLAVLSIYQPTVSVYISASAFIAISYILNNKNINTTIRKLISDISGLLIGYVLYRPVISSIYPQSEYFFGKGSLVTNDITRNITSNIESSIDVISSTGLYFWLSITLFISAMLVATYKIAKSKSLSCATLAFISFLVLILSILGPISITNTPYFAPRIFVGCSVLVFSSCMLLSDVKNLRYFVSMPAILSFIIIYTYAGAIRGEERRNNVIANEIQTIASMSSTKITVITVSGSPGFSSIAAQAAKKIRLIDYIVPRYFDSARLASAWLSLNGVDIKVLDAKGVSHKNDKSAMLFDYTIKDNILNIEFKNKR